MCTMFLTACVVGCLCVSPVRAMLTHVWHMSHSTFLLLISVFTYMHPVPSYTIEAYMHAYKHARAHTNITARMHVHMYTHKYLSRVRMHACIHTDISSYTHTKYLRRKVLVRVPSRPHAFIQFLAQNAAKRHRNFFNQRVSLIWKIH